MRHSIEKGAHLLESKESGVLTLTLNRPEKRNALSPDLYQSLLQALQVAASDSSVAVVVLTGAGGTFCAGGDVSRMAQSPPVELSVDERVTRLRARTQITQLLHTIGKPTIAMMSGAAVGAGLSLALACDLRIADTTSKLRTGFVDIGLSGDFGAHYFLPKLVGMAKARELFLLSPLLDAKQAYDLGLFNQLVEPKTLHAVVMQIAEKLARGPRVAIAHIKANLNFALHASLSEQLDEEAWRHVRCTETADHKEAARAYAEKRPPKFES